MNSQINDFINTHRVCALTTLLTDGSPHAAALHYSYSKDPFEFYFSTENTSRKCQNLLNGQTTKAAIVIGLSEEEWITLQMDGGVTAVANPQELENIHKIHYEKFPGSAKYKDDPATIFLKFTPTWWRYTNFNTKPETIISSE
ncbi:pyridoxamine 5'-phosphate oxidase family protein [Patescibacteria group bacterium]|nr:pyridoxamine 5'-phosphate oxidase family protein [Patescibacteria group bacterium]